MTAPLPYRANPPAIRRLCLAVDIESYSKRSIPEQLDLQTRLLWTLSQACQVAAVKPARCDRQDSGDGQILILPPSIDESRVLPGLVLGLLTAVRRANESPGAGGRMRLRISLGQGAIQVGATGFASQAVITVARLLDSAELRAALAAIAAADAAVVVTSDLYQDMFSQGYGGLAPSGFREVQIHIPAKQFTASAWIQVPVNPPLLLKVPAFPDLAALTRRQRRMRDLGMAAAVAWATFAGGQMLLDAIEGHDAPAPDGPAHDSGLHVSGHDGTGHSDGGSADAGRDSGDAQDQSAPGLHPDNLGAGHGHSPSDHDHSTYDHDLSAVSHPGSGHDGFADQVVSVDYAYGYDANGYFGSGAAQDWRAYDSEDQHDIGDHGQGADHDQGWDQHASSLDGHSGFDA